MKYKYEIDEKNECALLLTQTATGVKIKLLNSAEKGNETLDIHYCLRDLVSFLHGRPEHEFFCEYQRVGRKRHLVLVEGGTE